MRGIAISARGTSISAASQGRLISYEKLVWQTRILRAAKEGHAFRMGDARVGLAARRRFPTRKGEASPDSRVIGRQRLTRRPLESLIRRTGRGGIAAVQVFDASIRLGL